MLVAEEVHVTQGGVCRVVAGDEAEDDDRQEIGGKDGDDPERQGVGQVCECGIVLQEQPGDGEGDQDIETGSGVDDSGKVGHVAESVHLVEFFIGWVQR